MPPRYAYWTILVDDQPTAFRAGAQEDLMPTFKRLQQKHPSTKMMWFQNGKLWASRLDAQEAMRMRGEMGRARDERQGGFRSRDHKPGQDRRTSRSEKLEWKPRESGPARRSPGAGGPRSERPQWKPRGPAPRSEKPQWQPRESAPRSEKPKWQPRESAPRSEKPKWQPRESAPRSEKPKWQPRESAPRSGKPKWQPRGSGGPRTEKPEWKPRGSAPHSRTPHAKPPAFAPAGKRTLETSRPQDLRTPGPAKRKWVPKEEYKRSQVRGPKPQETRNKNWRPGGEHKDPRQKYKDAKKAKWTRFKQTVRKRWEGKQGKKKRES